MKYLCMFLAASLLAALGFVAVVISDYRKIEKSWVASVSELQKAKLEIGRAKTTIGDANQYIDDLEKSQQEEIDKHNATLALYGELKAKYANSGGSTRIITLPGEVIEVPMDLADYHYFWDSPELGLIDIGTEIPIDFQDFHLKFHALLSSKDGEPTLAAEYQLHINIGGYFVQAIQPDGSLAHYAYLWEIRPDGTKSADFTLAEFHVVVKDHRAPHFMLAPHVDIGGVPGVRDGEFSAAVSVGVSGWGYGPTQNDLIWRFGRLGMNATRDSLGVSVAPVLYNLGGPMPLFSNLWIGPQVDYDLWKGLGYGVFLGSVL